MVDLPAEHMQLLDSARQRLIGHKVNNHPLASVPEENG